ncbi:hypothetical protein WJU23_17705 [Prosthecobacter sp. SYSU 5D2]|uniref:hypothetical protein n=1 Tax=Prosthecobacter sp. SYSU 5D2 TaxID=3134134 RepID=UPI0031FEED85
MPTNSTPLPVTGTLSFDQISQHFTQNDDHQLRVQNNQLVAKLANEGTLGVLWRNGQFNQAEQVLKDAFQRTTGVQPSPAIEPLIREAVRPGAKSVNQIMGDIQTEWSNQLQQTYGQSSLNLASPTLKASLDKAISKSLESATTQASNQNVLFSDPQAQHLAASMDANIQGILNAGSPAAAIQAAQQALATPDASHHIGGSVFHALNTRGDVQVADYKVLMDQLMTAELGHPATKNDTMFRQDSLATEFARECLTTLADPYFQAVQQDAGRLHAHLAGGAVQTQAQNASALLKSMDDNAQLLQDVRPLLQSIHQAAQANPLLGNAGADKAVTNILCLRCTNNQLTATYTQSMAQSVGSQKAADKGLVLSVQAANSFVSTAGDPGGANHQIPVSTPIDNVVNEMRAAGAYNQWQGTLDKIRGPVSPVIAVAVPVAPVAVPVAPVAVPVAPVAVPVAPVAVPVAPVAVSVSAPRPPSSLDVAAYDSSPEIVSVSAPQPGKTQTRAALMAEDENPMEASLRRRDMLNDLDDEMDAISARADTGPSVKDDFKSEYMKAKEQLKSPSLDTTPKLERSTSSQTL